jgi:DNA polymerase-1
MAAMSQDERMIQAFLEGQDIHAQTAATVYGVALEAVTPQQRSHCKMVNFGIIYGISAFGLASRLRIQRREAQQLIDTYFEHYPAVKQYMDHMIAMAREKGYAETLFGRRRPILDLTSRNASTRAAAERIAINMPIQGTAADIIKFAMVALHDKLKARHLQTEMILQIHDELLFDMPDEERDEVVPLVRETMEQVCQLAVPLKVSIGVGPDWLSAH